MIKIALINILAIPILIVSGPPPPGGFQVSTNFIYSAELRNYTEAQQYCQTFGTAINLATITSDALNTEAANLCRNGEINCYFGLNDLSNPDQNPRDFEYIDGTAFTLCSNSSYDNFTIGEPNNLNHSCIILNITDASDNGWTDYDCSLELGTLCNRPQCQGTIITDSDTCCGIDAMFGCCDGLFYTRGVQECCEGTTVTSTYGCCSNQILCRDEECCINTDGEEVIHDIRKNECCGTDENRTVLLDNQECCAVIAYEKIYEIPYNISTHGCCNNVLYELDLLECDGGELECDNIMNAYNNIGNEIGNDDGDTDDKYNDYNMKISLSDSTSFDILSIMVMIGLIIVVNMVFVYFFCYKKERE